MSEYSVETVNVRETAQEYINAARREGFDPRVVLRTYLKIAASMEDILNGE